MCWVREHILKQNAFFMIKKCVRKFKWKNAGNFFLTIKKTETK